MGLNWLLPLLLLLLLPELEQTEWLVVVVVVVLHCLRSALGCCWLCSGARKCVHEACGCVGGYGSQLAAASVAAGTAATARTNRVAGAADGGVAMPAFCPGLLLAVFRCVQMCTFVFVRASAFHRHPSASTLYFL